MARGTLTPEVAQLLTDGREYPVEERWVLAEEIICKDFMTEAQWYAEEEAYHALPHFVVVDVEQPADAFRYESTLVKAFQFNLTDLLDDLVQANTDVNKAEAEISEYVSNLYHDIEAEGWEDQGKALLHAVTHLGHHLHDVITQHQLYTPSGCSMYEMHKWLDDNSIVLEKVVVRDWEEPPANRRF